MTTPARSRSWPSAGVRLRGRADDRWTRCSELLVSSRKRSTRQPELSQAGPSDSQRGGRARAHLNTANCRAAARAPSVQTMLFECRPCYLPLFYSHGRTQIALWERGCYVRGRSSGKTGLPGTTLSPRYSGGLKTGKRGDTRFTQVLLLLRTCTTECTCPSRIAADAIDAPKNYGLRPCL